MIVELRDLVLKLLFHFWQLEEAAARDIDAAPVLSPCPQSQYCPPSTATKSLAKTELPPRIGGESIYTGTIYIS